MKTYEVIKEFWLGGKRRGIGAPINLSDNEARNLVRQGKIVPKVQPKKKAAPKGGK